MLWSCTSYKESSLRPATFQINAITVPWSFMAPPDSSASARAASTSTGPGCPRSSIFTRAKREQVAILIRRQIDRAPVGGEPPAEETAWSLVRR